MFKTSFWQAISTAAVLSGMLVSVVKLILFLTRIENQIAAAEIDFSEVSFSFYLVMILVQFRPLLFGVLMHLVARPFTRNVPGAGKHGGAGKASDSAGTAPTAQQFPANPAPDFTKLSPREREVARLAARGYTNAQIADELYISVATVKRHLATIFEKLVITSRHELEKIMWPHPTV